MSNIEFLIIGLIVLLVGGTAFFVGFWCGSKLSDTSQQLRMAFLKEENVRLKCLRSTDMLAEKLRKVGLAQ